MLYGCSGCTSCSPWRFWAACWSCRIFSGSAIGTSIRIGPTNRASRGPGAHGSDCRPSFIWRQCFSSSSISKSPFYSPGRWRPRRSAGSDSQRRLCLSSSGGISGRLAGWTGAGNPAVDHGAHGVRGRSVSGHTNGSSSILPHRHHGLVVLGTDRHGRVRGPKSQ